MSRDRFKLIFSKIRFDDRNTRPDRINRTGHRNEAIRAIFTQFVEGCVKNYSPNSNITVDERLASYKGRCPFRVYIKSKPGKYGIKLWVASESSSGYIFNSQIYTGKINNQRETNQGQRIN